MTDERLACLEQILRERGETVTTAESCTGGMVAARLTDISGSSDVFRQGFVTYCDEAKHQLLGVSSETLKTHTAVSAETAEEMARGSALHSGSEASLSVTGYAGPASPEDPDAGLVYIGCYYLGSVKVDECHFTGSRIEVRMQARDHALEMLDEALSEKRRP